jgi:hypothetical protein
MPKADRAAEADEVVRGVEHLAGIRIGNPALRREHMGLVDDEAERAAILPQQRLGEIGEEPSARRPSSAACRSRPASSSSRSLPRPRAVARLIGTSA